MVAHLSPPGNDQPAGACRHAGHRDPRRSNPMPFVNEQISDADIDAYGLTLEKGKGHWWTRDQERDFYLWGGCSGNPAWGEDIHGRFHFSMLGTKLQLGISLGHWSKNWHVKPYLVGWDQLLWIEPPDCGGLDREQVISVLKEALVAYGRDGRHNRNTPERIVQFGF